MLAIELDPVPEKPRLESVVIHERHTMDFGIWTQPLVDDPTALLPNTPPLGGIMPQDVLPVSSYWRGAGHDYPPRTTDPPTEIADDIREIIDTYGCRVCVGNDGAELLMHHAAGPDAEKNVTALLAFADWAYSVAGERLTLSPMFFPIVFDLLTGSRFLWWAASHRVPLVWYWGWRTLHAPEDVTRILEATGSAGDDWQNLKRDWNKHAYPYDAIRDAIRETGVEVWTGAGFSTGLERGTMNRAEGFGYDGVFAHAGTWRTAEHNIREDGDAVRDEGL